MKHFKSLTALLLALVLTLVPFAGVLAEAEPAAEAEWDQLPLGNASYAILAPAGYTDSGVTDEEFAQGMIATYVNPDTGIDIDVYQYAPAEEGFDAFVRAQALYYGGTDLTIVEYQGGVAAGYATELTVGEVTYKSVTMLFDAGLYYIELDFYWNATEGDKTDEVVKICQTFGPAETVQLPIGSSPYSVTVTKGYYAGEITTEEAAEGLVTYYLNDNLLFDFDVYETTADESLSLADVALQLCTVNGGADLTLRDYNGIAAYTYAGFDEYDGKVYETVTCVFESTNGTYIAIVCWIDDAPMRYAAYAMLETLSAPTTVYVDAPMQLQIGSSDYVITLPTLFLEGAVSEEEFEEEGYAACYYSPFALFDIDLYQCAVADEEPTLEAFTVKDAEQYGGYEISLDDQINGVTVTSYRSVETYNDVECQCATYTFENKGYYFQLCFYWTDPDAEADVEALMETFAPMGKKTVTLGTSGYTLTIPVTFSGEMYASEDAGMGVARYTDDAMKFYVYDLVNPEMHLGLIEYAALECEYYEGGMLTNTELNGIPVSYYYYISRNAEYDNFAVITFCIENGETGYIDIDFLVDGYVSVFRAQDIMSTLAK